MYIRTCMYVCMYVYVYAHMIDISTCTCIYLHVVYTYLQNTVVYMFKPGKTAGGQVHSHLYGLQCGHQVLVDIPRVSEAGERLHCLCLSPCGLLQPRAVHRVPLLGLPGRVLCTDRPGGGEGSEHGRHVACVYAKCVWVPGLVHACTL